MLAVPMSLTPGTIAPGARRICVNSYLKEPSDYACRMNGPGISHLRQPLLAMITNVLPVGILNEFDLLICQLPTTFFTCLTRWRTCRRSAAGSAFRFIDNLRNNMRIRPFHKTNHNRRRRLRVKLFNICLMEFTPKVNSCQGQRLNVYGITRPGNL